MLTIAFALALRIVSDKSDISGDVGIVFIMTLVFDAILIACLLLIVNDIFGCVPCTG